MRHSLHTYIATVFFTNGGERDIHYDQLQCVRHGYLFLRIDESASFIHADAVCNFEIVKAVPLGEGGSA